MFHVENRQIESGRRTDQVSPSSNIGPAENFKIHFELLVETVFSVLSDEACAATFQPKRDAQFRSPYITVDELIDILK